MTVVVKDRGWKRIQRHVHAMDGWQVTIGVHGEDAANGGEIDNVGLAVVHEFGKTINHPGGTPYTVTSVGASSRSGGMVGSGRVIFLRKGHPDAIGITRAHKITIPERSFLRSGFDTNRKSYERLLAKGYGKIVDGTMTPQQVLGIIGEKAVSDVVKKINAGISPPLKPATIARKKGSSKPLIDTGQLKMAIKSKVSK